MGSRRRTISAAVATVLASISLYPVFSGTAWFWGGMGATITIALAGSLTRLRRLPLLVCLLGGLAGLLLYLNLIFAHARSLVLVIPTPSSLAHLWDLAGQGFSQSADYAPPVPELTGMVLLAAGGIGLAALLTDLIAVRLRSAALAGLPLLLLFTEPFTLSVSRGWLGTTLVFCLATVGYLTLLSSEGRERIRDWEQPPPGQRPGPPASMPPDTRALTAAGRRVGAASLVLALCVPFFVPGLHFTRLFGGGSPGIGGTGGTGVVGLPSPESQLGSDLREGAARPVLTYTTTASAPGYLQVYVLPTLTGDGWQLASQRMPIRPATPKLPPAAGLTDTSATSLVSTNITMAKSVGQDVYAALPVPYPAVTVRADAGNVQTDPQSLMVFDDAQLAGLSYSVTSEDVAPSEQELSAAPAPPANLGHYLQVPASYDALRGLAQNIVSGAKTPYAKAVALQSYFANGAFAYSLSTPSISTEAGLANFLNTTRTGYCQQFSYAMAVLARLLGIPSQVVYGYTQGTHKTGDQWTVTTHDAHAWPELYFQGYGWLRFEPTPGGPAGQGTATAPAYTKTQSAPADQGSAGLVPITSPTSGGTSVKGGRAAANRDRLPFTGDNDSATPATRAPGGLSPWALGGLSLLGLIIVIIIVPGGARVVIRRRRWRAGTRAGDAGLAHAAWLELRDDLTDYGAGYSPSETPRALAARIAARARLDAGAAPARPAGVAGRTATGAGVPDRETADGGAGATGGVTTLVRPADLADTADMIGDARLGDVAGTDGASRDVTGLDGVDLDGAAPADAGTALRRVTMAAERARYSARPASGDTLRQDITVIRHALAAAASRRARWRARVFPPSVVAPVIIALSQATDAFGRLNVSRVPLGKRRS